MPRAVSRKGRRRLRARGGLVARWLLRLLSLRVVLSRLLSLVREARRGEMQKGLRPQPLITSLDDAACHEQSSAVSGEGGIRTRGRVLTLHRFSKPALSA